MVEISSRSTTVVYKVHKGYKMLVQMSPSLPFSCSLPALPFLFLPMPSLCPKISRPFRSEHNYHTGKGDSAAGGFIKVLKIRNIKLYTKSNAAAV